MWWKSKVEVFKSKQSTLRTELFRTIENIKDLEKEVTSTMDSNIIEMNRLAEENKNLAVLSKENNRLTEHITNIIGK